MDWGSDGSKLQRASSPMCSSSTASDARFGARSSSFGIRERVRFRAAALQPRDPSCDPQQSECQQQLAAALACMQGRGGPDTSPSTRCPRRMPCSEAPHPQPRCPKPTALPRAAASGVRVVSSGAHELSGSCNRRPATGETVPGVLRRSARVIVIVQNEAAPAEDIGAPDAGAAALDAGHRGGRGRCRKSGRARRESAHDDSRADHLLRDEQTNLQASTAASVPPWTAISPRVRSWRVRSSCMPSVPCANRTVSRSTRQRSQVCSSKPSAAR